MRGPFLVTATVLVLAACASRDEARSAAPGDASPTNGTADAGVDAGSHTGGGHEGGGADGGDASHETHACDAFGIDGVGPDCTFTALCGEAELALRCDASSETCTCYGVDGNATKQVAYDPAFCATEGPSTVNFDAAVRACRWPR